ncbi:protein quaking-B-like [Octopus sinensis]|uniref:Protein quaking-B-like n=1 Tax=Octopus sinensis TaxID=2607531 RepID=A0A6P7TUH4_9MOLL|nr:protein quaking-B-like [Octopus sinensis]
MVFNIKLYLEIKKFNFVGRILGPRGMTAKQLEQDTGCKIMIRGRGSMRDKAKEEQNRGKPNWEHLNDDLHVLITTEDTCERADIKLKKAISEIKKLLLPSGEDELKRMQLMELAILNGTYRNEGNNHKNLFGRSYSYDQPSSQMVISPMRSSMSALGPTMYLGNRTANINNFGTATYGNGQSIVGVLGYISQSGYPPFVADMNSLYYVDPYMINTQVIGDYPYGNTGENYN